MKKIMNWKFHNYTVNINFSDDIALETIWWKYKDSNGNDKKIRVTIPFNDYFLFLKEYRLKENMLVFLDSTVGF